MTRTDHLLWILAEECAETAQRASKAARFGLDETQDGHTSTNAQRLVEEFLHIQAAIEMLEDAGVIEIPKQRDMALIIDTKKCNVNKFFERSREHGRLDDEDEEP